MFVHRTGGVFDSELLDERPGFLSVLFRGRGAHRLFAEEAGGHRWQRVPPTEKRGRVHTSTVTVAVLEPEAPTNYRLDESEVDVRTTRGTGPGGQNRNKVESCVIVTHRPSGTSVRVDMRSQHQSKSMALKILSAKLAQDAGSSKKASRSKDRKDQVGSGMRGDKIRTYRTQDDRVTDHRTGQIWKLSRWVRGEW